ncbi:hypothetical protein [Pectobacterium actinidiae]
MIPIDKAFNAVVSHFDCQNIGTMRNLGVSMTKNVDIRVVELLI